MRLLGHLRELADRGALLRRDRHALAVGAPGRAARGDDRSLRPHGARARLPGRRAACRGEGHEPRPAAPRDERPARRRGDRGHPPARDRASTWSSSSCCSRSACRPVPRRIRSRLPEPRVVSCTRRSPGALTEHAFPRPSRRRPVGDPARVLVEAGEPVDGGRRRIPDRDRRAHGYAGRRAEAAVAKALRHRRVLLDDPRTRHDPRERPHPDDGSAGPDAARARDRRRADRRRRRRARDGARLARGRRPRRAGRRSRASPTRTCTSRPGRSRGQSRARRLRVARRGARSGSGPRGLADGRRSSAGTAGAAATGPAAVEPTAARPRRGDGRDAGGDDREGLPLALAQLGRARARGRRPRGRRRRRRARRARRADRRAARGGGVAVQGALPRACPTTCTSTRCAPG